MKEWDTILMFCVLVGLFFSFYNPLNGNTRENTKAMTELTVSMKHMTEELKEFEMRNHEAHRCLWAKNDEQEKLFTEQNKTLVDHENRIINMEGKI